MQNVLTIIGLPLLFLIDYVAIVVWLMRTTDRPQQPFRFGLRMLLIAMTLAAVHLGFFAAFLHLPIG